MKGIARTLFYCLGMVLMVKTSFAAPVGRITYLEGRVDVLKSDQNIAMPASVGGPVEVGDIYRAKSAGKAEIAFVNKNILRIGARTRIEIQEYMIKGENSSCIMKLQRGSVQAISDKGKGLRGLIRKVSAFAEGNRYEVHTPNAVAGIRGSNMLVFHRSALTGVLFLEGSGYAYNPQVPDKVVPISGGTVTFIGGANQPPTPPRKTSESDLAVLVKSLEPGEKTEDGGGTAEEAKRSEQPPEKKTETADEADSGTARGRKSAENTPKEGSGTVGQPETPLITPGTGLRETTGLFSERPRPVDTSNPLRPDMNPRPLPPSETCPGEYTQADSTPPRLSIAVSSISPVPGTNAADVAFVLSSNEPVGYRHHLRIGGVWGAWLPTGATCVQPHLTSGNYELGVEAKDPAGNMTIGSFSLPLECSAFTGKIAGDLLSAPSCVTGASAHILNTDIAAWTTQISASGPPLPPSPWSLIGGGSMDNKNEYWIGSIAGTEILSGNSQMRFMSPEAMGAGTGTITGSYDVSGNWTATDRGTGTPRPLTFVNALVSESGGMKGLMGGTGSLWTATELNPVGVAALGAYALPNGNPHIWRQEVFSRNFLSGTDTTYDGGAYKGFVGGSDINGAIDGMWAALYIDPAGHAGFLRGRMTGSGYESIGMFDIAGRVHSLMMDPGIGITAQGLLSSVIQSNYGNGSGVGHFDAGGSIACNSVDVIGLGIDGQGWGVWSSIASGTYNGLTSSNWYTEASMTGADNEYHAGVYTTGDLWSGEKFRGSVAGFGAGLNDGTTWVSIGDVQGAFDARTNGWISYDLGAWIETNRFLQMAQMAEGRATLAALGMPSVEVGRTRLAGSDASGIVDMQSGIYGMNNVIFFARENLGKPGIWASGDISGSYSGNPNGTVVNLDNGAGVTADFIFKAWDTSGSKWIAAVENGNALPGIGSYSGSFGFHGAASGQINQASREFAGTGAGVVK